MAPEEVLLDAQEQPKAVMRTRHPSRVANQHRGPVPLEVRIRARASYAARLHELERIIDGTSTQVITKRDPDGRKTVSTVTPNAKEKVLALQELAKLGKLHSDDAASVDATEEQVAKAVVAALSDPAVRAWLITNYPDQVEDLRQLVGENPPEKTAMSDHAPRMLAPSDARSEPQGSRSDGVGEA